MLTLKFIKILLEGGGWSSATDKDCYIPIVHHSAVWLQSVSLWPLCWAADFQGPLLTSLQRPGLLLTTLKQWCPHDGPSRQLSPALQPGYNKVTDDQIHVNFKGGFRILDLWINNLIVRADACLHGLLQTVWTIETVHRSSQVEL